MLPRRGPGLDRCLDLALPFRVNRHPEQAQSHDSTRQVDAKPIRIACNNVFSLILVHPAGGPGSTESSVSRHSLSPWGLVAFVLACHGGNSPPLRSAAPIAVFGIEP